jgi:hypothetical protein
MKRKTRVAATTITMLCLIGAVCVRALARRTNPKESTIEDLKSTKVLKDRLQKDSDKLSLVALISPVCPLCRNGFTDIQTVLKNIADDRLRAHVVFLPMYAGDNKGRAQTRMEELTDQRVTYYWDAERLTGGEWEKTLQIDQTAWDVYMLYARGTNWQGSTPKPVFWMHQLEGITKAPCLNKEELETRVRALLADLR